MCISSPLSICCAENWKRNQFIFLYNQLLCVAKKTHTHTYIQLQNSHQLLPSLWHNSQTKTPFSPASADTTPLCATTCSRDQKPVSFTGSDCRSKNASADVSAGVGRRKKEGGKVIFDLKMKKTVGMCSPHTVSNGFSRQAEWILAELKIGGFLN